MTVLTVEAITVPTLDVSLSGDDLTFTWDGPYKLQAQTNTVDIGLSPDWFDYSGGETSGVVVTIDPANPTVFFRLSE